MQKIKVAVAEDNAFAMRSILSKLEKDKAVHVKAIAYDGNELLSLLTKDSNIDIILMDIQMPELNGIDTTKKLKQLYPQIKVVMLTTFDDDEKIFEAIVAGASGYLLKDEKEDTILKSIHTIYEGGAAMSPSIALKTLKLIRNPITTETQLQDFKLTKREIELLEQLKNGLSYEKIAENLIISVGTVQKHIQNIYAKLQVNNKVEAIQKAMQNRIV